MPSMHTDGESSQSGAGRSDRSQHAVPLIPLIPQFLQSLLDRGLTPYTIKVCSAAISTAHNRVEGRTVGSHTLVTRFPKGAIRLRPPRWNLAPLWDLLLVLWTLCGAQFEPLHRTESNLLSMKTVLLLAITSAKSVGEIHALSISRDCLQWHSGGSRVTLWPKPSFMPKSVSSTFVNQPFTLAAFESAHEQGQDLSAELLCPVRALRTYGTRTAGFCQSDTLFICHTGPRKGHALSKQRLSKWIGEMSLSGLVF